MNRKFGHFGSRQQGMNMRRAVWVCDRCHAWHKEKPGRGAVCINSGCDSTGFEYFASESEAKRYAQLLLQQRQGMISGLTLQPTFPVKINGILVFTYRGDFQYQRNGESITEDVKPKGFRDPVYLLKKKAVEASFGVEIKEVEF